MQNSNPKQAIIVNMAVDYPLGRIVAQTCHASVLNILQQGTWDENEFRINTSGREELKYWLKEHFTKVVFKVWGEDQLLDIIAQAERKGIPYSVMVEDDGNKTAIALGPSSRLDSITKSLKLL